MSRFRTRTSSNGTANGTSQYQQGAPITKFLKSTLVETCEDVNTTPGIDHPLTISKKQDALYTASGQHVFNHAQRPMLLPSPAHQLSPPHGSAFATEAAGKTNPGAAKVALPVAAAELRELPRLIKSAGDGVLLKHYRGELNRNNILRTTAQDNLAFQFGIKPMVDDVKKLLDFNSHVAKRVKEINALHDNGGSSRRYSAPIAVQSSDPFGVVIHTALSLLVVCEVVDTTAIQTWATVKWKPSRISANISTDEAIRKLAYQSAFGVSKSQVAVNAWNLIPWSWLYDWTGSIGDFLEASNNSVASLSGRVNVMSRSYTTRSVLSVDSPVDTERVGDAPYYESKVRNQYQPTPFAAQQPVITGRKLGILASLVASYR